MAAIKNSGDALATCITRETACGAAPVLPHPYRNGDIASRAKLRAACARWGPGGRVRIFEVSILRQMGSCGYRTPKLAHRLILRGARIESSRLIQVASHSRRACTPRRTTAAKMSDVSPPPPRFLAGAQIVATRNGYSHDARTPCH